MFIVLEGLDGAGKSTQIRLLRRLLSERGVESEYIHFPRFDAPVYGELIARFLRGGFGGVNEVDPYLVALLFAGDRADAGPQIRRWIAAGKAVVLDRFVYSNVGFQCAKLPAGEERDRLMRWILDLEFVHNGLPRPATLALARAGGSELKMRDVESVVPKGVTGEDSAAFMKVYIDRWVRKQLKLQEAEILFSASADDIDKMVEEYRQALLIRKLDQHYVDRSIDTTFTENEIAAYYNAHKADFRLDRTLVKGRIVQFGEGYRQARKLRELMGTKSEARQQDFRDICAKNDFTVTDFSDQWVDFPEFLSYLPTLRSQNYDPVLASTAVQEMRDSHSHYYFQIDAVRREGEPIPLERLRGTIRRILFNQRQSEIIRSHEEELYNRACEGGSIKIFENENTNDKEKE